MLPSVLLVAATLVVILVFRPLMQAYRSTKRNIPGPLFAKFSRLWYLGRIWTRRSHLDMIDLHKKYGKDCRLKYCRRVFTALITIHRPSSATRTK
jgi:hypothetical protein